MNNTIQYPRVLLIYNSRINKADQHGVSIRSWFGDWPRENLAQIYSGGEVGDEVFCNYNFKLGQKERRFGNYFFKLKKSSIGQSSYPIQPDKNFKKLDKLSFWSLVKNKIGNSLIKMGLWEIIFRPRLSNEMLKFVERFDPQIIYCQGYSLTFSWLPVMIQKRYQIPICFQTGDDWPTTLYKNSVLSFAIRPVVHRAVKLFLSNSAVRLANGKLMAADYRKRYNLSFEVVMMCDNLARFRKASPCRVVGSDTISIVYAGGLANGRWASIVDLCRAAELLQNDSLKIKITTFATLIPKEAINDLEKLGNLQMLPGPSHEDLPSYLKGADILFLPESFNSKEANAIRLSISTKAHLYMMSERPILVYASPVTGIMNYAKEEDWACIVEEQDLDKLSKALLLLISDKEYSRKLVGKGLEVVLKNHDEVNVKARFLSFLKEKQRNRY